MDDLAWYIFQSQQQTGPFGQDQLKQMLSSSMIAKDAYLFKVGWKDWRPVEECMGELGLEDLSQEISPDELARRKAQAPRATIKGRVDVHNDAQVLSGLGVNISASGIFIETTDQIFQVGEHLKLTVRCEGLAKPFNVAATVVRFNTDSAHPLGYGLRFEDIPDEIKVSIDQLVMGQSLERNVSSL